MLRHNGLCVCVSSGDAWYIAGLTFILRQYKFEFSSSSVFASWISSAAFSGVRFSYGTETQISLK